MQRLLHEQVYLDTNIFIAAIEAFNSKALALINMAEKGFVFLLSSEVTRGELLVKPMMNGDEAIVRRYEALFNNPDKMTTIAADAEIMKAAAELSAKAGLELLDAVHCATATVSGCAFIISDDRDVKTYSEIDVLSLDDLEFIS